MKDDGGPAFPVPERSGLVMDPDDGAITEGSYAAAAGMTLRDYFAGQALAGLSRGVGLDLERHDLASRAYGIADAMLAERAKQ